MPVKEQRFSEKSLYLLSVTIFLDDGMQTSVSLEALLPKNLFITRLNKGRISFIDLLCLLWISNSDCGLLGFALKSQIKFLISHSLSDASQSQVVG